MKGLLAMMMGSGIGKHQHQQQQQQQRQRQQLNLNVTCTKQIRQRGGHRGGGGQTEYDIVSDTLSALSVYMTSTPSHTHPCGTTNSITYGQVPGNALQKPLNSSSNQSNR